MEAILILSIISIQFALIFFGVKHLSLLNKRLIFLNQKIEKIIPQIEINFKKTHKTLSKINFYFDKYNKNKNKIKLIKILLLINSLVIIIITFQKKKNILNFYSLYDITIKTIKTILGF